MGDLRLIVNPEPIVVDDAPAYRENPDDKHEHQLTRAEMIEERGDEIQARLADIAERIRAIREGHRAANLAQLVELMHSALWNLSMAQHSLLDVLKEPPVPRPKRRGRKPRAEARA